MTTDHRLSELAALARAEGEASDRTRAAIRALRTEGFTLRSLASAAGCSKNTIMLICRAEEATT